MKTIITFFLLAFFTNISGQNTKTFSEQYFVNNEPLNLSGTANWVPLIDTSTGVNGINGAVYGIAVDGITLYVGGSIQRAGGRNVNNIAKWDGNTWSALGTGLNGSVYGIAISGDNVYVVGSFSTAGGIVARGVAKWNGTSWSVMGSELFDNARCIAVDGNNVFIGGKFTNRNYIARWNGSSWNSLSTGMNGYVYSIAVKDGLVYAGGSFSQAGGTSVSRIAKWDGSSWTALEGGSLGGTIYGIAPYGTNIFVCGDFVESWGGIANRVAKWDGTSWSKLSSGLNGVANALTIAGEELYVGGNFTSAGGSSANKIAKWNGSAWSAIGEGTNNEILSLGRSAGTIYIGGAFTSAGGSPANYIVYIGGSVNCAAIVGKLLSGGGGTVSFNDESNTTAVAINLDEGAGTGQVDVYLYNNAPADASTYKNINSIQGIVGNISNYRWIIESSALASSFSGTIRFKVSDIPNSGISNPNSITVYSRETPGSGEFATLPTSYDSETGEIVAEITSFSEFAFGSEADPLPVEIIHFTGSYSNNNLIELYWKTATEVNNYGFEVERQYQVSSIEYQDSSWETIGFVQGSGTTNSPKEYSFTDDLNLNPNLNQVSYRLKQIDLDGTFNYSKIITVDLTSITKLDELINYEFSLEQNYPNPFNPSTSISYRIAQSGKVKLTIYDILAREITILVDEYKSAGNYKFDFNSSGLSSGTYFYKLESNGNIEVRKMMLIK